MFDVFLHPLADKFLKNVDVNINERIRKKLKELKKFPERGKHLKYTNFWSLGIGDCRAIYEIHKKERKIIVLFIGHIDDVYDDISKLF